MNLPLVTCASSMSYRFQLRLFICLAPKPHFNMRLYLSAPLCSVLQPITTSALYNDSRTIGWSVQGSGHPSFVFVTYCTPCTGKYRRYANCCHFPNMGLSINRSIRLIGTRYALSFHWGWALLGKGTLLGRLHGTVVGHESEFKSPACDSFFPNDA